MKWKRESSLRFWLSQAEVNKILQLLTRAGVDLIKAKSISSRLFGSRYQEMQRLGRLFHCDYKGEHIILMTAEQYTHRKLVDHMRERI
jgi:hypothetical protein